MKDNEVLNKIEKELSYYNEDISNSINVKKKNSVKNIEKSEKVDNKIRTINVKKKQIIYDNIESLIYINLDERKDRNQLMQKYFQEFFPGKKIERFSAMTPDKAKNYEFIKSRLNGISWANIHPGIIGCYCSHYLILKQLLEKYKNKEKTKPEYVIVFEDDTHVNEKFIETIKKPLPFEDWNIIMGINPSAKVNKKDYELYDKNKKYPEKIMGSNIMIYNLNNIQKIYETFYDSFKDVIIDFDMAIYQIIEKIYFINTDTIELHLDKSETRNTKFMNYGDIIQLGYDILEKNK